MPRLSSLLALVVVAGVACGGLAFAQTPPPEAKAPPQTTTEKVKTITKREWNRMKGVWAKEKEKWAGCNKQAKEQKLTGRKSWQFIATCMTS